MIVTPVRKEFILRSIRQTYLLLWSNIRNCPFGSEEGSKSPMRSDLSDGQLFALSHNQSSLSKLCVETLREGSFGALFFRFVDFSLPCIAGPVCEVLSDTGRREVQVQIFGMTLTFPIGFPSRCGRYRRINELVKSLGRPDMLPGNNLPSGRHTIRTSHLTPPPRNILFKGLFVRPKY